ncbi:MAG: hypothetical protein M1812_007676 [Candelaria pacifica]|nr:MAG: hypothetical protein M1812_007676 [Candelaria pacifica]
MTEQQPPPPLLPELQRHLKDLEDASCPIETKLFDKFETQLTGQLPQPLLESLIVQLSSLLPTIQQDPTPLNNLIIKLTEAFTFSDVTSLKPSVDFVAGLQVSAQSFNILTLTLLRKAALSASDTAIVAGKPEVVGALIDLWLCTTDVGIVQKAEEVLWELLETDFNGSSPSIQQSDFVGTLGGSGGGQGLMWRRVFKDRDIYGRFFSACSPKSGGPLGKREKTLAQARLLDMIPRLANLDWSSLQSQHPDIERQHGLKQGDGLLEFAAVHMVDTKDDVLMHLALIDFYSALLRSCAEDQSLSSSVVSLESTQTISPPLNFMISRGLHARTSAFYLNPDSPKHDPLDVSFLSSRSANYLSVYASCFPSHLLRVPAADPVSVEHILLRLSQELDISPAKWAHGASPAYTLHLLASLPRVALLPQRTSPRYETVILKVPSKPANPDALHTLATIFNRQTTDTEAAAARALYALYISNDPYFYSNLVTYAETIALKDNALAALDLISAIITAKWEPLPTSQPNTTARFTLPTESELTSLLPQTTPPPPASGIIAILTSPAQQHILPYLLKPAQTFTNLVGGRGDAESAAYKIAVAKYDALKLLHTELKGLSNEIEGLQDVLAAVENRVAEGAWSVGGEVGGRIGTLEL